MPILLFLINMIFGVFLAFVAIYHYSTDNNAFAVASGVIATLAFLAGVFCLATANKP